MPLPPRCPSHHDRTNWIYHPAGKGATHVVNGVELKYPAVAGSTLTTCKVCGGFIGYANTEQLRKSMEAWAKKQAAKSAGEVQVEGVGV
jgi:hypothetical protein